MPDGAVLLLDDDRDLRESLAELVAAVSGRRCLALANVAELKARRSDVLACALAILDINLGRGEPSGLDAYAWLQGERFAGRVVFLTGHARSHPLVARAAKLGGARVYQKPIGTPELRALLDGSATVSS